MQQGSRKKTMALRETPAVLFVAVVALFATQRRASLYGCKLYRPSVETQEARFSESCCTCLVAAGGILHSARTNLQTTRPTRLCHWVHPMAGACNFLACGAEHKVHPLVRLKRCGQQCLTDLRGKRRKDSWSTHPAAKKRKPGKGTQFRLFQIASSRAR